MSQTAPAVLLLIGDDDAAVTDFLNERISSLGDSGMAELNLTRLDGRQASNEDIRTAANAIPFLAERRILILTNPLARLTTKEAQTQFCSFLENLPPTSEVILVLADHQKFKEGEKRWEIFNEKNWLIKWVERNQHLARVIPMPLPPPKEMPGWIRKQAQRMGGQFTPAAAAALADFLDNNTRLAKLEIEKLLLYVDYQRPVDVDDVDLLTANTSQASIFEMVDALSSGNAREALHLFQRLLEVEDEALLFGMIVRQFRLLLQTREILDENVGLEIVKNDLRLHPYAAQKMIGQARRFSMTRLEQIYRRLLEIDEALKTSQTSLPLAIDLLAAELAA